MLDGTLFNRLTRVIVLGTLMSGVGGSCLAQEQAPTLAIPKGAAKDAVPAAAGTSALMPWYRQMSADRLFTVKVVSITADYHAAQPAESAPVVLARQGTLVSSAKSGPSGVTQLAGVREGLHSVVTISPAGIGSFGIYVAPSTTSGVAPIQNFALVPASDSPLIRQLLSQNPPANAAPIGEIISPADLTDMESVELQRYYLSSTGTIVGRLVTLEQLVVRASPNVRVSIIRSGKILGAATTDSHGVFRLTIPDITPGFIGVVANGAAGFSVMGAELVSENVPVTAFGPEDNEPQFVAFQDSPTTTTTSSLSSPSSRNLFLQNVESLGGTPPGTGGAPGAAGTPPGGGAGGGGGGAGGGGGLLGAAGLAAGAAAIGVAASNDDNKPPASPSKQ